MASSVGTRVAIVAALILLQSHPLAAREVPEPPVPLQPQNPTKVVLVNQIGADLTLHCKFNGDDLGSHVLSDGQNWEYSLRPKFDWINSMTCTFQWPGRVQDFDAYKQKRDVHFYEIYWYVGTNGLCRTLEDGRQDCFPWN